MDLLKRAVTLESLFTPTSQFFWLYLLSAVLLALAICYLRSAEHGRRSLPRALRSLLRPDVLFHPSARTDYVFVFANHLLFVFVITGGLASTAAIAAAVAAGLDRLFGPVSPPLAAGPWSVALFTLAGLLAYDLGEYIQHRLQHRIAILWEFHKVHHSAEVLTPITAIRTHPVIILYKGAVIATVYGLVAGLFAHFYAGRIGFLGLMGANVLIVAQLTIGAYHLQHSHVWFVFPPPLRRLLISPAHHMIHHSARPEHFDRNFGAVFTLWDRVGRTYHQPRPEERDSLRLGLPEEDQNRLRSPLQLYLTPFRRAAALLAPGNRPPA